MRIQHNIPAMNSYRNYTANTKAVSKNLEKLSSGYRINRAGDDAAGLAISEKMRAQVTGLKTAQKNAKDGISLIQTAEGALTEVHSMLNRMVELADQSANGTYSDDTDRDNLQKEFTALRSEIDRISKATNFNGISLLDGTTGLNTKAFKDIVAADIVKAGDATGIVDGLPDAGATVGTNTIVRSEATTARAGKFTIDLSQLALKSDGATAGKVKINIGGTEYEIEADDANTDLTGTDIASKLVTVINAANSDKGHLVGSADTTGLIYEAADGGDGTITLTTKYDGEGTALTDGKPTSATADTKLAANFTVEASRSGGSGAFTGAQNLGTTNITTAQKDKAGTFANTSFAFDISKVTDGMKLEIAGESYTFAVGKDSTQTGANVIDLKDLDLTNSSDQTKALDRLTAATAANATFTIGHNAAGKITLAEKTTGAGVSSVADAAMIEKLGTKDGIASLIKVTTPAQNASTTMKVDAANIKEGDILNVDGKEYVFTKDATTVTGNKTAIVVDKFGTGSNALSALEAQLTTDGYTAEVTDDAITISAKTATGAAPSISGGALTLQIGDTSDDYNQIGVSIGNMNCETLGIDASKIDISYQKGASDSVKLIKSAINSVSSTRGDLGAVQNRLEHTINNLSVMTENIQDAESTIRDVDVAEEMMAYTKNNILVQSAQAMLAQANQLPQGVLQLLG